MDKAEASHLLTRRALLRYGAASPFASVLYESASVRAEPLLPTVWPRYILRRDQDELFLKVTAVNFEERYYAGVRWLYPVRRAENHYLIFEFAPQHFAEVAIATDKVIPTVFDDTTLNKIALTPSASSKIVFLRRGRRPLRVQLDELLFWDKFELVLPDLDQVGEKYDLDVEDTSDSPYTRVEIPWGIELTPAADPRTTEYSFEDPLPVRRAGSWVELWTTALTRKTTGASQPIPMEVLGVRGFDKQSVEGSPDQGTLVVTYTDDHGTTVPPRPTPLSNYSRIDIATSLSRRFPYTGTITPLIDTGIIKYTSDDPLQSGCIAACFAPGRAVSVSQLRLSARGGWLQLEGKWDPFPGCALSGWVHTASLGRDHHVELVSEGFLFPFGIPCELLLLSERVFVRDQNGHFVAPLIEQLFLQIPQPNSIVLGHAESPFTSLSVTTKKSPPLDLPPGGDPETYRHYDFFLPMVGGVPFSFEHLGTDWDGNQHRASMPMFFVSNKARAPNGLIWEPGLLPPSHRTLVCPTPPIPQGDISHAIPQTGDGLRVVDKAWALQPGRFAQYGGALVTVASNSARGEASQRIDWIEWTRGNIPDLQPAVVSAPFRPRARTMRVRIQSVGQVSGEPSSSIVTYRDTRFTYLPILDPEPTTPPADYFVNVTAQSQDPEVPYLYVLETRALVAESGPVSGRSSDQVAQDLRDIYYGVSLNPSPIPSALFLGVDNEVRFGRSSSTEGIGGLSVPDTHLSLLTRKHGVLGDATFNEGRWNGYDDGFRTRLQTTHRLDYAAFARLSRPNHDVDPFDRSIDQAARDTLAASARSLMGITAAPLVAAAQVSTGVGISPGLKLGDLFGANAQILPGLAFKDIFSDVDYGLSTDRPPDARAAMPLAWNIRTSGIEWLTPVLNGDVALSIPQVIEELKAGATPASGTEQPLSLGMEATLRWSNDVFHPVTVGPVKFSPTEGETRIEIDATARIDLGVVQVPQDGTDFKFSPGKAVISARAKIQTFSVIVFGAIQLDFSNVSFEISADGHKEFSVHLASVKLLPPLDFIDQLAKIFGGLGEGSGIHVIPSPQQIQISQTLQFPAGGTGPLFMGPAQITNLALGWSVTIPLTGRDVLAAGFSVSSREKPLTIYVPPWYGGKAYALIEATTRGCRLVEVSMEYGALIPVTWGIATGQASLTAGVLFMIQRDNDAHSGTVVLKAFVKAAADLSVAGIIQFAGLIYISLARIEAGAQKIIQGVASVSVSIKIGFIRVSYSFSAVHEEVSNDHQSPELASFAAISGLPPGVPRVPGTFSTVANSAPSDGLPFGPVFRGTRREAFERLMAGYRN